MKKFYLTIVIMISFTCSAANAEYYKVYVKRDDSNLYMDNSTGLVIKTKYCYEYTYGDEAVLIYEKYSHSKETEYLYLVQADKYIKIGVAKDPINRLVSISTGCPFKPELIATKKLDKLCYLVERYLHILYADNAKKYEK